VKKIKSSVLSVLALTFLSTACLQDIKLAPVTKKNKNNYVTNESPSVNEQIGDDKLQIHVISEQELQLQELAGKVHGTQSQAAYKLLRTQPQVAKKKIGKIQKMKMLETKEQSLILGLPVGLIGEQSIFGGVITKVTDKTNESLGTLKLTDLTPIHVRPMIAADEDNLYLALVGCVSECSEESEQNALIYIPIVKVSDDSKVVYVDLTTLGKGLDLIKMLDPSGGYTKLRSVGSSTTTVDYSLSTLVFDIVSKMVPVETKDEDVATAPKTEFTVRWYLKLNSAFNPAFTARNATEGVGYFKTERSKESKITRFSTTDFGKSVKYYIKNVPEQYKPVFAKAFDNWNEEFTKIIGRDLLSYEFVDATDPRAKELVAGDIRYNIMEWDLDNNLLRTNLLVKHFRPTFWFRVQQSLIFILNGLLSQKRHVI
jgi:hypothetical protein